MKPFDKIIYELFTTLSSLPDKRTGGNIQFSMQDIGLTAFAVFFMQSPSFLYAQESLQKQTGRNNLKTLFRVKRIPSDNHVRAMLDPINPNVFHPVFDSVYKAFQKQGVLDQLRGFEDTQFIAMDGTQLYSSNKIKCDNCSTKKHKTGAISYHHNAVTPVIVAPHRNLAIPLRIEFLSPQDGHDKQDSEPAAAKRWLDKNGEFYNTGNVTLLGDDLYSKQPFCRKALLNNYHFIFVCKPSSHTYLYKWVDLLVQDNGICTQKMRIKNEKGKWEIHHLRYCNNVQNLCSVLATLNILAFLMHTFLDFNDRDYKLIRLELRSRKKFFEHVRILTYYQTYASWEDLMKFMIQGLEIHDDSR